LQNFALSGSSFKLSYSGFSLSQQIIALFFSLTITPSSHLAELA
jgi:hypothetical protein